MSFKLGNTAINKLYLWNTTVTKAYLWTTQIFTSSSTTYATLDPSNKDAWITLSVGNTVATRNSTGSWKSAKSTIGKSSWKWYWEITIGTGVAFTLWIWNSSASNASYVWSDANWWSFYSNTWDGTHNTINNNSFVSYWSSTYTGWDVLWVALDMDSGTLTFYKNNSSFWTAFSGLSWTIFAMIWLDANSSGVTCNFGATPMTYTSPSGYNQWLYA